VLGACGAEETGTTEKGIPPPTVSGAVEIATAQKPFLTVEAVGSSKAGGLITLPGRVAFRPQAQSAIGATTPGRVVALLVRAGEPVKAGTPLFTIESSDAAASRATLDVSATRLATAESVHRRNVEMMERGVGLEVERQEAEARLKEARTEHERARSTVNLIGGGAGSRVTVRAPSTASSCPSRGGRRDRRAGRRAAARARRPDALQVVAQVAGERFEQRRGRPGGEVELPALAARVPAKSKASARASIRNRGARRSTSASAKP
jgi:cobalt-zinc-cadmium efflux system membrane fusion protein